MKFIPLGDKIIVRSLTEVESSEASAYGIFIPDSTKIDNQAIVIAVGEGVYDTTLEKHIPSELRVGDRILHASLGTWKEAFKYEGQDCYVISESNVLAYAERS